MREAEYTAARESAVVFELAERAVLSVGGPTRQKFLNGILSNEVAALAPGQGCRAALMSVKGQQLAWMRVLVAGDAVLLELPSSRLEAVEAQLTHYRVAAPVRFARPDLAVLGVAGPRARDTLRAAVGDFAELAPEAHATPDPAAAIRIARAGDMPREGYVVLAARSLIASVAEALGRSGAMSTGRETLDALRIEDGRPWYGVDVTEENLLHETGLLREYHSPTKGCYVGQEVVARLDARGGHVNKALRGLRLQAPAAAGDALRAEGAEVGRVTTAAVSPRLGPIAMGYVHRSRYERGTMVEVNGMPATVALLPLLPA